ncbi:hypothetical protein AHAS_Ahas19G0101800 [Arachis hypogaea]
MKYTLNSLKIRVATSTFFTLISSHKAKVAGNNNSTYGLIPLLILTLTPFYGIHSTSYMYQFLY